MKLATFIMKANLQSVFQSMLKIPQLMLSRCDHNLCYDLRTNTKSEYH